MRFGCASSANSGGRWPSAAVQCSRVEGGTIGRSADNDWVLPDPQRYVSAHHARVHFRDGHFYLQDVSTNGVFVNDDTEPLAKRGSSRLSACATAMCCASATTRSWRHWSHRASTAASPADRRGRAHQHPCAAHARACGQTGHRRDAQSRGAAGAGDRHGTGAAGQRLRPVGRLRTVQALAHTQRPGTAAAPSAERVMSGEAQRRPSAHRWRGSPKRRAASRGAPAHSSRSMTCTAGSMPSAAAPALIPSSCRRRRRDDCCTSPVASFARRCWDSRSSSARAADDPQPLPHRVAAARAGRSAPLARRLDGRGSRG